MGIVYKLIKHQRCLEMLSSPVEADGLRLEPTVPDKRITAEHILQFCKILTETSNSAKSGKRRRQQKQKCLISSSQDRMEFKAISDIGREETQVLAGSEMMDREIAATTTTAENFKNTESSLIKERGRDSVSPSAIPLNDPAKQAEVMKSFRSAPRLYGTTIPPANTSTCCSLQHRPSERSCKKDILQKIRSQILERKRQRQLVSVQRLNGVWRPW